MSPMRSAALPVSGLPGPDSALPVSSPSEPVGCFTISVSPTSDSFTGGRLPMTISTEPLSETSAPSAKAVWPPKGWPVPEEAWLMRLLGLK